MANKKNKPRNVQGRRRAAADDAAAKKARAEAATWREIAEKAADDYSKREGKFTRRFCRVGGSGRACKGMHCRERCSQSPGGSGGEVGGR